MVIVYSPLLVIVAFLDCRAARHVRANRARGEEDDDSVEEWEELQGEVDVLEEGWQEKVAQGVPDVEKEPAVVEILLLRTEINELKAMIKGMARE